MNAKDDSWHVLLVVDIECFRHENLKQTHGLKNIFHSNFARISSYRESTAKNAVDSYY